MDAVLHLAESLLTSPWLFALVAVLALFDSVLPIVPAETVVIAAAAYAATGNPNALLLIGSAWAGALLGDVEIGRASCRERVKSSVVGVAVEEQVAAEVGRQNEEKEVE